MARTTLALTSFVSGEFGNKLTGRTDFDKYQSAAKTMENFLVHPQGAATRRVGTQFIAPVKTAAAKTRLIPFEFSTTQTYVLEFGNNYIRFFKDKGQILSGGNPYEISTPYLTAELFDIKFAQSADVMYLVHPNHQVMKLSRTGHTSWSLDEVDFTDGPYLATNSTETTLTPSGAETTTLNGTLGDNADGTSGSTIALTSASGFPTTGRIQVGTELISYSGVSTNNLTGITRAVDGSTRAAHSSGATVTNAGIGSRTITASAVTGINGGAGFLPTDVGRLISFNSGIAKITSRTNTTVVVCTVSKGFTNTDATADWKLGAFSDTTGHPSCVSFYEQRLVFAGTTSEPQTIFFSKAGDYEHMGSGTNADDAMVYTIAANQVNVIRYLKAQRTLVIGTTAAEYTVSADGTDASITPTNITIKRQSSYGSANVDAVTAGNAILFLQKAKRKIRELAYNFDSDSYVAPDLCILNDTVTDSGIVQMEWQQEPDNILWCVREDGQLAALTYQRSENVVSWHRHILGGSFGSGNAVVESIASISGDLNEDELWVIVKRTVNGATVRYVECFSDFDFDETTSTDFKFLDSHLSYSGSAVTSLSGLSHLEGQTVSILADGSAHANKVVNSGSVSLDRSVTKACIGLPYDSILQTMRIEGGSLEGTSQGKIKRISKVVLRLFETVGVKVGPSLNNLETIPFRTTSSNLSAPVNTLIEGDKEIEFNDDYNSDGHIFIKQDQPLPASILAIYPTLVTNDG